MAKECFSGNLPVTSLICYIYIKLIVRGNLRAVGYLSNGGRGMPMEVNDALTLMIGFGALIVALLTLVVTIVVAFSQKK